MDVRIGVTQSPRELSLELPDDVDRDALKQAITNALAGDSPVLAIVDRKGREVLVPGAKLAYVELGSAADGRRIGFGS